MSTSKRLPLVILILSLTFVFSCREQDEDQPPGDGGGVPPGMTRLYGTVRDDDGQPISNAALHVIYETGSGPLDEVAQGAVTFFYTTQPLYTECNGSVPLPDGIRVQIFWDVDGDGPDNTDPQPPLCNNPPDCLDGPAYTVNQIEFPINSSYLEIPGTFYMDPGLVTVGELLSPNIFYTRVYCTDGNVLWESDPVDVPSGPSEFELTFHCTQCEGIPEIPVWSLSQSYPNPATDSVTIHFSLEQAAQVLLTLRQLSNNRLETLLIDTLGSGGQSRTYDVRNRANGLYEYRFSAGTFAQSGAMLKNETDTGVLAGTPEIDLTESDGRYRFDTAAGVSIDRRGEANENQGTAFLDHVHVIAIHPNYLTADTLVAITSAESLNVDITLHSP